MSEISKFKNEVSTRIMRHCDLNEYEKDLLNLLSPNELLLDSVRNRLPVEKVTTDTGVNTDISMCNAIFNVQYFDNQNRDSVREKKSPRKNSYQNVKIDELWKNQNFYGQNIDDEIVNGFTSPIVESPETSKNDSSHR